MRCCCETACHLAREAGDGVATEEQTGTLGAWPGHSSQKLAGWTWSRGQPHSKAWFVTVMLDHQALPESTGRPWGPKGWRPLP